MTSTIPQYARTTDPTVIAAIEANRTGRRTFHDRATAFAAKHGSPKGAYLPSSFAGMHNVRAIGGTDKPTTGRWKRGWDDRGWRPFKNTDLERELDAIQFVEKPVPGLPDIAHGDYTPSGAQHISPGTVFVHEGVAYVGYPFAPTDDTERAATPADWEEIKASQFHAAMEAFNEAVRAA